MMTSFSAIYFLFRVNKKKYKLKINWKGDLKVLNLFIYFHWLNFSNKFWSLLNFQTKIFQAGVDGEGEIKYLHSQFYEDAGITFNDNVVPQAFKAFSNVYNTSTWGTKMYDVKTDKPSNIWSRAGGKEIALLCIFVTEV